MERVWYSDYIDQHGRSVGVPIKASDFHFKPTLRALQERFSAGKLAREKHAVRLRNTIDKAIASGYLQDLFSSLQAELKSDGVVIVPRHSKTGLIYGLTYVDHRTKSVFNGSNLGKAYSAKALLEVVAKHTNSIGQKLHQEANPLPLWLADASFNWPTSANQGPASNPAAEGLNGLTFSPQRKRSEYAVSAQKTAP